MRRRLKRVLKRLLPFKGTSFYEVQVGPLVFQIPVSKEVWEEYGWLNIWHDPYWI